MSSTRYFLIHLKFFFSFNTLGVNRKPVGAFDTEGVNSSQNQHFVSSGLYVNTVRENSVLIQTVDVPSDLTQRLR